LTCTIEHLAGRFSRLRANELDSYRTAICRGYLVAHPFSTLLIDIYLETCFLNRQPGVFLLPGNGGMRGVMVSLPDLASVPSIVRKLVKCGAFIEEIRSFDGFISATIPQAKVRQFVRALRRKSRTPLFHPIISNWIN